MCSALTLRNTGLQLLNALPTVPLRPLWLFSPNCFPSATKLRLLVLNFFSAKKILRQSGAHQGTLETGVGKFRMQPLAEGH